MTDTSNISSAYVPTRMFTAPKPPILAEPEGNSSVPANASQQGAGQKPVSNPLPEFRDITQQWYAMALRLLLGSEAGSSTGGGPATEINTGEGNDTVDAWENAKISTGAGDDTVRAWSNSSVDGGEGNDQIDVWSGGFVNGGEGEDQVSAWSGSNVSGGSGNDRLDVWSDSYVDGGAGDDDIKAWSNTVVYGGDGNDTIDAWSDSHVDGGDGNDKIRVHVGSVVTGGKGDDTIQLTGKSTVRFDAGDGKDVINSGFGAVIELGEGLSADALQVSEENGRTIITFAGNDTDQITLVHALGPVTLKFADGSEQKVGRGFEPLSFTPEQLATNRVTEAYSQV